MKKGTQGCLFLIIGVFFLIMGVEGHAAEKPVTVNRFLLQLYSDNKEEAIPIRNASAKVLYYDSDGKRHTLCEGIRSDNNGEIKEVTVNLPEKINRIYFQFCLTNPEVGSLVNSKGALYYPIVSLIVPENRQIDHTETRFIMNRGEESTKESNYQAIKVWNLYQDMVNETKEAVQTALEAFPELKETFNYTFEPIPVLYEYQYRKNDKDGAFLRVSPKELVF